MSLSMERYNSEEFKAREGLPNRFIEAFAPITFDKAGYPSKITDEKEIVKYIDSMHALRLNTYMQYFGYAPTDDEFLLMKSASKKLYDDTKERFGKGIVVKAPLLSSIHMLRKIYAIVNEGKKPRIFEIGGGAGIFGGLLNKLGYEYVSTDVSQAFYLTQHYVCSLLGNEEIVEYFDDDEKLNAKYLHIPYWKLWEMRNGDLHADIVVSNHNLSEMHERSLDFYLVFCKKMLRESKYQLIISQFEGSQEFRKFEKVVQRFDSFGYGILYSGDGYIVFAPLTKPGAVFINTQTWIEAYLKENSIYHFPLMENTKDFTASRLAISRIEYAHKKRVDQKHVQDYFETLDENIDSPDEEFWRYISIP